MKLHELKPAEGSKRARRRVGRGIGSGMGYDGDVLRIPSWRTYSGSRSRYIYFRKSLFIRKSLWVSGSVLRRCSEQIFTFCHEYYPVHQFFHYYAASDFRYSHIGRMAERRAGRV